jgi:hypothetical protein
MMLAPTGFCAWAAVLSGGRPSLVCDEREVGFNIPFSFLEDLRLNPCVANLKLG